MLWKSWLGQVIFEFELNQTIHFNFSVVHGSLSTILGVFVLAFIDSYMVLVFFKTISLVLIIGAWHALMLLPILLSMCIPVIERLSDASKKASDRRRKLKENKNSVYAINLPVNVSS